ncbi:MAG: hypothetical protein ACLGG7_00775 [Bacteriovoracia bacterium]
MSSSPTLHYFIGPLNSESQAIMDELKGRDEFCIPTVIHEEIDQGQKQVGKVVLVFSDIKFMLEFFKELNTRDSSLKIFLVINQNGSFKPPVMTVLRNHNVTLIAPKDRPRIYEDISRFISGKSEAVEEIEFSVTVKD